MPLHQCGAPECLGHGRVEGLRAIDDHQQAPVGAQPAAAEIGQEPLTDRRVLRGPFPQAERVFRAHGIDASGDNATVSTHVHAINQQPHQVQRVERRRPPRIQLRLSLRDNASTDRTLARAPRGDVGAERFQTPRILAGRHTDQHLVDHAPVQRVRIRECPGRWQRNLLAGAPRTGPTNRHLPPAQHDLTRRMPRSIRLARRLMRIPWPTDGGPILFQHGFEYLQARRDDQLLELGLRINEAIDQRQVPWRRGYRSATARDCARLLLHGGS